MSIAIVTGPEALVSLAEAKLELGIPVEDTERDGQIERYCASAQSELDGPFGWVGISVAPQTLELRQDEFDDAVELPYGPVREIVSFTYVDSESGLAVAVDPAIYYLTNDGTLALIAGEAWPTPLEQSESIAVTYDVGVAEGDKRIDQMKTAILMKVRILMDMTDAPTYERAVENICRPLKVWTV